MSVSLHNLNISLDSFNAAASGTYNIGQIKLNQDGTGVYRTNSHKTFTILNRTEISQDEAVAVKEAFCRAVKNEAKLDDDAVKELKDKLGIGSDKFSSMRAGTMKALTAAEVREVIDKYAGRINQGRAEGAQLKTSADLYKGVSQTTLDSRAEVRDKVNAQTLEKFAHSQANVALNSIMDLMDYQGGDSISVGAKALAKRIIKCAQRPLAPGTSFKPFKDAPESFFVKSDMTLSARVTLDNGYDISIDLGVTQKQLLDKLFQMVDSVAIDEKFAGETKTFKEKRVFSDPSSMSKSDVEALKKQVLEDIKESFGRLKTIEDPVALKKFRGGDGGRMENIVESLQTLLVAVRGHDPRNAVLVNRVRDVFHHDAAAGNKVPLAKTAALCDKLFEDLSEVLNKERSSLRDDVDRNIEAMGKPVASKEPQAKPDQDDDDLPALNINQLTGFDV